MTSAERNPNPWLNRPLCRRYVLGIFEVVAVQVRDAQGVRDQAVHWAWGWLADGECEPLGAWIGAETGADSLGQVFADLKDRGVERIWHVTCADVGVSCSDLIVGFAGPARSSIDRLFVEGPGASRWDALGSPALVVEQVRDGLVRAIRRHGCFDGEAAVLDFVAGALQRTERRLDRGVMAKGRPRQATGAPMVAPGL